MQCWLAALLSVQGARPVAETALDRARKKFEQARARLAAVTARENASERKRDTRRKVILGGALMELATRDPAAAAMLQRLMDGLSRDHDKKAFEGWRVDPVNPEIEAQ